MFCTLQKTALYQSASGLNIDFHSRSESMQYFYPASAARAGVKWWVLVSIYIYIFVDRKKIESYFSDGLTFSNILGRTSR